MAIYSFNHDSIGKTTNHAGAAGDNVHYNADLSKTQMDAFLSANAQYLEEHGSHRPQWQIDAHLSQLRNGRSAADNAAYNARREATYAVRSHIIPAGPDEARAWFDAQEKADRKNARMSDRFIGALPRELTPEQCIEAVEGFCRSITQDRVPWHFALHLELDQKNEPNWNPHTHIIFRDRDIETGRRFLHTSAGPKERRQLDAKGVEYWSTQRLREKWSEDMNRALERAGHDSRIDHRSLKEQGFDREAQIHIGPASQKAASKGFPLDSHDHVCGDRTIAYSLLDDGSRAEHNARIVERNTEQAKTAANPETRLQQDKMHDAGKALTGHQPPQKTPEPAAAQQKQGQEKKARAPVPEFRLADGNLRMNNMRKAGKSLTERDPVPEAWNRFLADQRPRTREEHERRELLVAQHRARRTMYTEQRRDREAMRQAHDAQGREHRAWSRKLYTDARQNAFELAKQQNAKKWEAVRQTTNPMKRKLAAAKVKLDQKHAHTAAKNKHLAAARKANDKSRQALIKQQTQERHDLRATHQKELGMLARQQVAERLATDYRYLAEQTQSAAARTSARMSNAHNLAGQHNAANRATGDHARRRVVINGETVALPGNPLEASRAYLKLAHAEHAKRKELRQTLTQQRDGRIASRQSALINVAGYEPADRRSRARRPGHAFTSLAEETQQQRADKAAQAGRILNSDESNSASPEVRAQLDRNAKRRTAQREMFGLSSDRPSQDKGRTGGGRGR